MSLPQVAPMRGLLGRVNETAADVGERLAQIHEALKATDSIAAHNAAERIRTEVAPLLKTIIIDTCICETEPA